MLRKVPGNKLRYELEGEAIEAALEEEPSILYYASYRAKPEYGAGDLGALELFVGFGEWLAGLSDEEYQSLKKELFG
jgi:hypothetical protein